MLKDSPAIVMLIGGVFALHPQANIISPPALSIAAPLVVPPIHSLRAGVSASTISSLRCICHGSLWLSFVFTLLDSELLFYTSSLSKSLTTSLK